ncbi:MAG: IS701 family transposase [Spirosoma sp.]|nr:IS701 family transposase [Spirosoma sp.]
MKAQQFLKGLFHEGKSNIERMHECIPDSDYQQLHHFISESNWDAFAVMRTVAQHTQQSLQAVDGEQGLLLDESGWEKAGTKSVGVARQYIGQVGKVCNAQVGMFAALVRGDKVGLVNARLYLPAEWTDKPARCKAIGVPAQDQSYKSKPQLAVAMLSELAPVVSYDWVGGDSIYGNSPDLRTYLLAQQQRFVLDVGSELTVFLTDPSPAVPPAKAIRGRQPTRAQTHQPRYSLSTVLAGLGATGWQMLVYRRGSQGKLVREAQLLPVWLWKPDWKTSPQALSLLISREVDGSAVKYSLVYEPSGQTDLLISLQRQMQRYWVERAFQDSKEQLGLHQNQTRCWAGWYHHVALTLMALHFMLETRLESQDDIPLLSCSDIKLMLARTLLNKLHQSEGIWQAIEQRHRQRFNNAYRYIYQT